MSIATPGFGGFRSLLLMGLMLAAGSGVARAGIAPAASAGVAERYGKLPLSFEANQGQTDARVKFLARGPGYAVFLTADEAVLTLRPPENPPPSINPIFNPLPPGEGRVRGSQQDFFLADIFAHTGQAAADLQSRVVPPHPNPLPLGEGAKALDRLLRGAAAEDARGAVLRMRLEGARTAAPVRGRERLPGTVNYLKGRDPAGWRTGVATYGRVEYRGVYPGIDLVYYGHQRQLEYDFVVAPGADPNQIRLSFAGEDPAAAPRLEANGDLLLPTGSGAVRLRKPVVYQDLDGRRRAVEGRFVMLPPAASVVQAATPAQVGFQVGAYDPTRPLVIDPVLAYSTYLGGSDLDWGIGANGMDWGNSIAVDGAGNAYVTGTTQSSDFPTVNAKYPQWRGGLDAFVFKLSADGRKVLYSTYLGGSLEERGLGISVDGAGNAHVTGITYSSDFPTVNAKYPLFVGSSDAFVFKLSADGQTVRYSTYLGGSSGDDGYGIAVDAVGNAYVTGGTSSHDFPTINAIYPKPLGGVMDAFVVKFSADGQNMKYSTYLGGSDFERAEGIAVDSAGNAFLTGYTSSPDFPTVNARYPIPGGGGLDAFVVKLSADGRTVRYATYLGGSGHDEGISIAVDGAGNAHVIGWTMSPDFPTVNAIYPNFRGEGDAFVFKLSADGRIVHYSTYLGGSYHDRGARIAVDGAGNAHVTGETWSSDFPTVNARYPKLWGYEDAFVFKLSANGQTVRYSTYLGGSGYDLGHGIAVDGAGNTYVTGATGSGDFPTSATDPNIVSYDSTYNGGFGDAFIAKLIPGDSPDLRADLAVTLRREGAAPLYLDDSATLELSLVNRGPVQAPGVTLSLPIPEGLRASTAEPDCAVSNQVLNCALGDLNAKALASRSVKLTVTGPRKASTVLTATGTSGAYDPAPGNNRASLTLALNPRVAVVLVHGWNGSPDAFSGDGKWLKPSGAGCLWPLQTYRSHGCLPRLGHALRADAGLLIAQPFDYSDKTPFGDWSIEQLAGELHKHIQCVKRGECMADKQPVDRIDIVAHSMGGLISRAYIAGMALDKDAGDAGIAYDGSLRRLVTVGTPHYGTTAWRLTQAARQSLAGPRTPAEIKLTVQGDELAFGSPFVWNLNAYWEERVVKTGAFPASNLLTLRGWADFDCNANYFDGIVDLASATLPNDALQAFLPDSQVRQAFAKHTPWLCIPARPALVALPKSNQSNPGRSRIYQLVKSFLDGTTPPGNLTPPATYLNRALVLVRLIDKTTGDPVNIAPILGFNASLKFDEITLPEGVALNEAAATLTASPVPLKDSRQTATLHIIPPSGYLAPPARKITLYAGRPTIREIALTPKP